MSHPHWTSLFTSLLLGSLAGACMESAPATCDDARERIRECYGDEIGAKYQCSPEHAQEVVDYSCAELAELESSSDTFSCGNLGIFCDNVPEIFPSPSGTATRYPVVLAHGFNGSPTNDWGVKVSIVEALQAIEGQEVYVAAVSPFKSAENRGIELAQTIDFVLEDTGADKVNIIAHSMGGLDARVAISSLAYHDRVSALVTISTPHQGSLIADVALELVPGVLQDTLSALSGLFARSFTEATLAKDSDLFAAMDSLSVANVEAFDMANPMHPSVYYQSWAGVSNVNQIANPADLLACGGKSLFHLPGARHNMSLRLMPIAAVIAEGLKLIPNDGMATVSSAIYGDFQGCIPADHYTEIGQGDTQGLNAETGFDAEAFFKTIVFDLQTRGF